MSGHADGVTVRAWMLSGVGSGADIGCYDASRLSLNVVSRDRPHCRCKGSRPLS
jgi:hypothetical protein